MAYAQSNLAEFYEGEPQPASGFSKASKSKSQPTTANYEEEILELVGCLTFVQSIAFD